MTVPTRAPGVRATQREVRTYAEELLQALRAWRTHSVDLGPLHIGSAHTSRYQVIGIGRAGTSGIGGTGSRYVEYLVMPGPRQYTTAEVVDAIRRMAASSAHAEPAALLERIRAGRGPASLVREGGWAAPTPWSKGYAAALFLLAVQLGDSRADRALDLMHIRR